MLRWGGLKGGTQAIPRDCLLKSVYSGAHPLCRPFLVKERTISTMEFINGNIYLTEPERQDAGFIRGIIPLCGARVAAEELLRQAREHEEEVNAYNWRLYGMPRTIDDTQALPLAAWKKIAVAQRLLDVADLELGMEE